MNPKFTIDSKTNYPQILFVRGIDIYDSKDLIKLKFSKSFLVPYC